jgi:hypothetical protein
MTAVFTGLNSSQPMKAGFTFFTSLTHDNSHAHYYPGAKPVLIKIVAEEGTGRLLGAQVLGERGIDKHVDVLATAITGKMSVFDLENLDLAYSPPFGSAKDSVLRPSLAWLHQALEIHATGLSSERVFGIQPGRVGSW